MKNKKIFFLAGGLLAFLGIITGAFGAHGLKASYLSETLAIYETAVRYQFYHALALILTGLLYDQNPSRYFWAGFCWLFGTFLFSGSLYVLVFSGVKKWGAVTPVGGMLLLVGWLFFIGASCFSRKNP